MSEQSAFEEQEEAVGDEGKMQSSVLSFSVHSDSVHSSVAQLADAPSAARRSGFNISLQKAIFRILLGSFSAVTSFIPMRIYKKSL